VPGQVVDRVEVELPHHVGQAGRPHVVAGDQRQQIAARLDRVARVRHDDGEYLLVHHPLLAQAQVGHADALLVDRACLGREADAADVGRVAGGGEEPDRPLAAEHRRHHDEVEQVSGAEPRVVGDEDVAGPHGRDRVAVQEVAHGGGHRVDVARRACHRLGEHAPARIVHARREVARLPGDGPERGVEQRLRLLLDHGDQPVPHHLHVNAFERFVHRPSPASRLSMTR
jgi:hypothetical protein